MRFGISLGEDLEGIASILLCWQSGDAGLKVCEIVERLKKSTPNKMGSATMLGTRHTAEYVAYTFSGRDQPKHF